MPQDILSYLRNINRFDGLDALRGWASRIEGALDREKVNPCFSMIYRPHAAADGELIRLFADWPEIIRHVRDTVGLCDSRCEALQQNKTGANRDALVDGMMVLARRIRDAAATLENRRAAKPASPVADDPAQVALTQTEAAVFDVLTDEGMTGRDVLTKLWREGIRTPKDESALSRVCKGPAMFARGVRHRKGAGYYKLTTS